MMYPSPAGPVDDSCLLVRTHDLLQAETYFRDYLLTLQPPYLYSLRFSRTLILRERIQFGLSLVCSVRAT
jgi:hypothetical protein